MGLDLGYRSNWRRFDAPVMRCDPLTKPSSCEACSAFTRVAACTLALSPIRDTLIEGFSHFVTSMTAPIASGWSESPGGACTHWKAPPCHGAPPNRTVPLHHPVSVTPLSFKVATFESLFRVLRTSMGFGGAWS